MATVDFENPNTSQNRVAVHASIRDHVAALSRFFDGDTLVNTPVGATRFNTTTKLFERWGGSSWSTLDTNYARKEANNNFSANQTINVGGTSILTVAASTSPQMRLENNGAAANNRNWLFWLTGATLELRAFNDDYSGSGAAISFARSGAAPSTIFTYSHIDIGGNQASIGRLFAYAGTGTASGLIGFLNPSGGREGYIGSATTTAGNDAGTIPYVAATHSFTGNVTVSGTISGNGSGLTSINASNLSSGTLSDARLSTNVALRNAANTFTEDQAIDKTSASGYWIARAQDNPGFAWWANTPAADNRRWFALMIGSNLEIRAYNDAGNSSNIALQFTRSGITPGNINTYSNLIVGGAQSGVGRARLDVGDSNRSGYVAFLDSNNNRQGFVGWSSTTGGTDTGTIEYHAGLHSFVGAARTVPVSVSFSSSPTFNARQSNVFYFGTLTGNVTSMTISNPTDGQTINIRFVQDGTGGRTVTLPSGTQVSGSLNTAANAVTWLVISYVSSASRWEGTWTRVS